MATLIQGAIAGSASVPYTTQPTIALATGSFPQTTAVGNLLLLIIYASMPAPVGHSNTIDSYLPPSTPGLSWSLVREIDFLDGWDTGNAGMLNVYYKKNAPSISASTVTTVHARDQLANGGTLNLEFALYEFSGVDNTIAQPDFSGINYSPTGIIRVNGSIVHSGGGSPGTSTPSGQLISALGFPTLQLFIYQGDSRGGANLSAGAGYVLGANGAVASLDQLEYIGSVASIDQTPSFGGSLSKDWVSLDLAFQTTAALKAPNISPLGVKSPLCGPEILRLGWCK